MDVLQFFLLAGAIIFLGFVGEQVFKRTNIPDIIWLMLFGILIGPVFHIVSVEAISNIIPVFTTFALVFILFEGSLNIKLKELFKGMYGGSVLSSVNFFLSAIVVMLISLLYGFDPLKGLLLGFILGGTSSAVIIPIIKRLKIKNELNSSLTLETALTDVFVIIFTLTLIQIIQLGSASPIEIILNLLYTLLVPLVIGALVAYVWILLNRKIVGAYAKSYIITIGVLIILYAVLEYMGASGAIACLSFGIILGNGKKIIEWMYKEDDKKMMHQAEKFFYSEITFILKSFFFVYLGLITTMTALTTLVFAVLIVVGMYLIRPVSIWILFKKMKLNDEDASIAESMFARGLAAAVVAQIPAMSGIPGTEIFSEIVIGVIIISIVFTTISVYMTTTGKTKGVGFLYRSFFNK